VTTTTITTDDVKRTRSYIMPYTTPELISIGSATNLVLANESNKQCLELDNIHLPNSRLAELW
jgi:hypothetical protein